MDVELETAYIGLDSRNPAAVAHYLDEVVGLMPGDPTPQGHPTWRVDGKTQRVFVRGGERDDAACVGFEAVHAAAFERVQDRLRRHGAVCAPGSAQDKAERRVRELVRVDTPWGVPLELVLGLQAAMRPFASMHFPEGLITQGMGFGHFVFLVGNAADYDASRRFALDGLGLRLSDWLRLPMGDVHMNVSFFHCNPRHHSLAIAFVPMPEVPQRLHHVNFEVARIETVGVAFERALHAGAPIANTIGQHDNDGMVSFYSRSPGGWQVEIGATGRVIGDDWTDVREYDRISRWGHQPPEVLARAQPSSSSN